VWQLVATALDAQADRIAAMRSEACTAAHVRLDQTEEVMADRMQCLDRRTSELAALAEMLAGADAAVVAKAGGALGALGRVEDCADVERLRDALPLPTAPAPRAEVLAIQAELDRVDALDLAGKSAAWIPLVKPLVDRAAAVDWGPVRARALTRWAAVLSTNGKYEDASVTLVEAATAADRGRDDVTRAHALVQLARLELSHGERFELTTLLLDEAEAAADRARVPEIQASVYVYRSRLARKRGQLAESLAAARRAVVLGPKFEGNELFETERELASVLVDAGKLDEAEAAFHRVIDRLRAAYGTEDNAEIATALGGLAQVEYARGNYDRALDYEHRELAIYHRLGESTQDNHISARAFLGLIEHAAGKDAEAEVTLVAVLDECDARIGKLHSQCTQILYNLAGVLGTARKLEAAVTRYREVIVRLGTASPGEVPDAMSQLGKVLVVMERPRDAIAQQRAALGLLHDQTTPAAATIRIELAQELIATGALREAVGELQRIVPISDRYTGSKAAVRMLLARTLWKLGDHAGADQAAAAIDDPAGRKDRAEWQRTR
jgi:tetratricopeptide (TPR) repeat protein